jgi:hypothetical protein
MMKKLLLACTLLAFGAGAVLADVHVKAGPRKGRILEMPGKNAEFFVEKDRTISIAFYDKAMKPVAPAAEVVTAVAEAPAGKTKLEFTQKGNLLVSRTPLPAGENYQVVVQARPSAEGKPQNFRIKLQLYTCKGCNNPEYACICDE